MNWRRGLLRAWVVVSICWVVVVGGLGVYYWYNDPWRVISVKPLRTECQQQAKTPPLCDFDPDAYLAGKPQPSAEAHLPASLWTTLLLSILPPVSLFFLGAALLWVGQGFRERMPPV
jgi:hypothetical protein